MATKHQNAPHTHHKPKYTDIKTWGKRSVENCHNGYQTPECPPHPPQTKIKLPVI